MASGTDNAYRAGNRSKGVIMKIVMEGPNSVKLIPDGEHEKEALEALWKVVIRCDEDSKVLCPIGAYVPSRDDGAQFAIQDQ